MDDEKEELAELYRYLNEHHYDNNQSYYILTVFRSLQYYYEDYMDMNAEMIDRRAFIKKYVDILKSVEPITFLKDINQDITFLQYMKPVGSDMIPAGYIKDEKGQYQTTKTNPEYWCSLVGLTTKSLRKVTILFDDTIDYRISSVFNTLIHELTHIDQRGFEVPWYVMNRDLFIKLLEEGHAISTAKYVNKKISGECHIPFAYNDIINKFLIHDDNLDYGIYRYLYLKLEVLLGHDFLNAWASTKDDNTFMSKAYKLIDAKYGKGTFKKLYENILIILNSKCNIPKKDLQLILEEQQDMSSLLVMTKGEPLEKIMVEHKRVSNILDDEELFKKAFENEKNNLLSTKQSFAGVNLGSTTFIDRLNERIANLTAAKYRYELENVCSNLENEIDAKSDVKYFKMITNSNFNAAYEMLHNPNYITDAVVNLEALVLKCIQKDMDNHLIEGNLNYQKYRYYIYNVGNKSFNYKAMKSVKKQIDYLSMSSFLQEHAKDLQPKEGIPSK